MNQICEYCGARFFALEKNTKKKYTNCCNSGKVNIPPMSPPTPVAEEILLGMTPRTRGINKRSVNTACAMASISMEAHAFSPGIPSLQTSYVEELHQSACTTGNLPNLHHPMQRQVTSASCKTFLCKKYTCTCLSLLQNFFV